MQIIKEVGKNLSFCWYVGQKSKKTIGSIRSDNEVLVTSTKEKCIIRSWVEE